MQIDQKMHQLDHFQSLVSEMFNCGDVSKKCCYNCTSFDIGKGFCRLLKDKVPVFFRKKGCESWDGLPF